MTTRGEGQLFMLHMKISTARHAACRARRFHPRFEQCSASSWQPRYSAELLLSRRRRARPLPRRTPVCGPTSGARRSARRRAPARPRRPCPRPAARNPCFSGPPRDRYVTTRGGWLYALAPRAGWRPTRRREGGAPLPRAAAGRRRAVLQVARRQRADPLPRPRARRPRASLLPTGGRASSGVDDAPGG